MNKKIIAFTIILSLIGLLSIYSSSYIWSLYKYGYSFKYLLNQSIFFIIGIVMMRVMTMRLQRKGGHTMKKISQLGFVFGIIGAVAGAAGIVLGAIGMVKNR